MAQKKATKAEKIESDVSEIKDMGTMDLDVPEETPTVEAPSVQVKVLNRYRVEKFGNDAHIFERIKLTERYAGKEGVQEFEGPNGKIIYYTEKLVKKYSDNVVQA